VTGLVNGETQTHELFQFRQTGVDEEGNVQGFHTATGNHSVHMDHFAERGETLPIAIFDAFPSTAGATA
jgi:hypothetical protein